jgi:single-strand DNA-binding protein
MSDTNIVVVKGNLVRDAELKYTSGGTALMKFALANNRGYPSQDGWKEYTNFVDCSLWGKRAESLVGHFTKGKAIIVTGELKQNRWQNESGQNRSKMEVRVDDISFAGGKGGSGGSEQQGDSDDDYAGPTNDEFPEEIPF